jgi:hypothetical protein
MFLAGCGQTLSQPVFQPERFETAKTRISHETFTIDEDSVKKQIEEMVFEFMDEEDLDELILDNASCQDGLRGWIEENGYRSPGFASARRDHENGYPPNSLIACCGMTKFYFLSPVPKSIPEASRVATAIVKEFQLDGKNH